MSCVELKYYGPKQVEIKERYVKLVDSKVTYE
jgi:hypothetical protein